MLACYAEVDSLYLESLSADGVRQFASFGTGDDADDSLEGSPDDIREFSGRGSLGFSDVLSLFSVCGYSPDYLEFLRLRHYLKRR